jgi:hypothetical protein
MRGFEENNKLGVSEVLMKFSYWLFFQFILASSL